MPTLPKHDPLALKSASREQINARRDELEEAPVEVDGKLFDADERSDRRMFEVLENWSSLGLDSIEWTLADNTTAILTRQELEVAHASIRQKRTARGLALHKRAWEFKLSPNTTLRDIEPENWLQSTI